MDLLTYVKPGKAAAFSAFINQRLKAEATDPEEIFGEGNPDSGHLYPTGKGLTVVFSPDEITPYVMGAQETSVSAGDGKKFFQSTPDTRVLFGW